jgi:hypothetical protein
MILKIWFSLKRVNLGQEFRRFAPRGEEAMTVFDLLQALPTLGALAVLLFVLARQKEREK